jgi:hypothetical protein
MDPKPGTFFFVNNSTKINVGGHVHVLSGTHWAFRLMPDESVVACRSDQPAMRLTADGHQEVIKPSDRSSVSIPPQETPS